MVSLINSRSVAGLSFLAYTLYSIRSYIVTQRSISTVESLSHIIVPYEYYFFLFISFITFLIGVVAPLRQLPSIYTFEAYNTRHPEFYANDPDFQIYTTREEALSSCRSITSQ